MKLTIPFVIPTTLGPLAVDLADIADLAVAESGGVVDIHENPVGMTDGARIAIGHGPGVAQQAGRLTCPR